MKRKFQIPNSGSSFGDLKKDLTQEELAGIGAVAILYNELEYGVDMLTALTLRLPQAYWLPAVKRIGSSDSKIELVRMAADEFDRHLTIYNQSEFLIGSVVKGTLDGTSLCKKLRDAVVHCRVYNSQSKVAVKTDRGIPTEVLVSRAATDWLYATMQNLIQEQNQVYGLFSYSRYELNPVGDRAKLLPGPEFLKCFSQLPILQKSRQSLGPPPTFPN